MSQFLNAAAGANDLAALSARISTLRTGSTRAPTGAAGLTDDASLTSFATAPMVGAGGTEVPGESFSFFFAVSGLVGVRFGLVSAGGVGFLSVGVSPLDMDLISTVTRAAFLGFPESPRLEMVIPPPPLRSESTDDIELDHRRQDFEQTTGVPLFFMDSVSAVARVNSTYGFPMSPHMAMIIHGSMRDIVAVHRRQNFEQVLMSLLLEQNVSRRLRLYPQVVDRDPLSLRIRRLRRLGFIQDAPLPRVRRRTHPDLVPSFWVGTPLPHVLHRDAMMESLNSYFANPRGEEPRMIYNGTYADDVARFDEEEIPPLQDWTEETLDYDDARARDLEWVVKRLLLMLFRWIDHFHWPEANLTWSEWWAELIFVNFLHNH